VVGPRVGQVTSCGRVSPQPFPAVAAVRRARRGADYNLLLISRFKEEIGSGLKTGIIRAMAGTGGVVTAAGLVFAATMSSFIFSDLQVLGQIGTTIGLGLLFDTLIVRSLMTPSIAALLGRWFWWPQNVRPRPASQMLRPYDPATSFDNCSNTNQRPPTEAPWVASTSEVGSMAIAPRTVVEDQPAEIVIAISFRGGRRRSTLGRRTMRPWCQLRFKGAVPQCL
jgi:hypothetical protein